MSWETTPIITAIRFCSLNQCMQDIFPKYLQMFPSKWVKVTAICSWNCTAQIRSRQWEPLAPSCLLAFITFGECGNVHVAKNKCHFNFKTKATKVENKKSQNSQNNLNNLFPSWFSTLGVLQALIIFKFYCKSNILTSIRIVIFIFNGDYPTVLRQQLWSLASKLILNKCYKCTSSKKTLELKNKWTLIPNSLMHNHMSIIHFNS